MKLDRLVPLGCAALMLAVVTAFWRAVVVMWERWFPAWRTASGLHDRLIEGESYYTHGPLVLVVSGVVATVIVRHSRIDLRSQGVKGGMLLGLFLLAHVVGSVARVNFVSAFSLVGVLSGLVVMLWGSSALRRLWFPLAFLLFMVPLPEVTIADINFRLKMASAQIGVDLANLLGVAVERVGNRVLLDDGKSLVIANVCNGLRTLISLLAFGALYAFVCRLRGWWRAALFAMSVPVAVAANAVRVVSLILVADIWSPAVATGAYHEISGLLVFVLAFLLMFLLEGLVLWGHLAVGRSVASRPIGGMGQPAPPGQWSRMAAAAVSRRGAAALAALALTAAAVGVWSRPVRPINGGSYAAALMPSVLPIDGRDWVGYDRPLDPRTQTILETSDYFNRTYVSSGQPEVEVCIIFSQDNRKGTHPPDLCLEGGGSDIVAKGNVTVAGVPCRELTVQSASGGEYFLYTYKCGGDYTRSFWRQQWALFINGLLGSDTCGALVRVSVAGDPSLAPDASKARARQLLEPFLAASVVCIEQLH